jgi:hypothetical protein
MSTEVDLLPSFSVYVVLVLQGPAEEPVLHVGLEALGDDPQPPGVCRDLLRLVGGYNNARVICQPFQFRRGCASPVGS